MRPETKTRPQARLNPEATAAAAALMRTTLPNALMELLQNARRAGARTIDVEFDEDTIRVRDDGHGITDPPALLEFGRSAWTPVVERNERPAGIGLDCLADRGARILSRTAAGRRSAEVAWAITLRPTHFDERRPAKVERCEGAPEPHGTSVAIRAEGVKRWALEHLVRHFPVPVRINGRPVEQHPFIDEDRAVRVYDWHGLRVALFAGTPEENESQVSFHGAIAHLPLVKMRKAPWARVEVVANQRNDLQFERPGYGTLMENAASNDLLEEIGNALEEAR